MFNLYTISCESLNPVTRASVSFSTSCLTWQVEKKDFDPCACAIKLHNCHSHMLRWFSWRKLTLLFDSFSVWSETSASFMHQTHQMKRSRNFICQYCWRAFISSRDLCGHVNSAHLNRKPFVCDLCHRSFAGKKTLNTHRKTCAFSRVSK